MLQDSQIAAFLECGGVRDEKFLGCAAWCRFIVDKWWRNSYSTVGQMLGGSIVPRHCFEWHRPVHIGSSRDVFQWKRDTSILPWQCLFKLNTFHTSVQHAVARVIDVTLNTVYATLFMYCPLLEDIRFIGTCFRSVEPSSGTIHTYENYYTLPATDPLFLGLSYI
jgi:hypothetical protein